MLKFIGHRGRNSHRLSVMMGAMMFAAGDNSAGPPLKDILSPVRVRTVINTDQSLEELKHQISILARKSTVVLQWIPAHCGISGNEKADELAKNGSKMEQPNHCLSYREAKTLIKHRWKEKFTNTTSGYKPHQDPLHLLSRAEQAIIFRLRTGHCCLKAHLRRIGVAESATCDCGEGDQTPEHMDRSWVLE
ncbi:uncharacterized protein [Littorina saxatilis]|uniref:uncharacterized protein n=1 Tax=Littorina saxatilis TaxID=31220 RepID=UPI0038B5EF2A